MRLGGNAGGRRRPFDVVPHDVGGERLESHGVRGDEGGVVEALGDDHVHHPQGERGIGAGADEQRLVRLRRRLGAPHVDVDDVRAAPPRQGEVPAGVRLACEVRAPEDDQRRVLAHVLLGVHPEDAGEPQAEGAQAPADHRRVPPLAAVEVGEAPQQLRRDAGAVVVGEEAVAGPGAHRRGPDHPRPFRDGIEGVVPADLLPGAAARPSPQGMEEPARVVDDLARRMAADAEEPAAVGVVRIAPHAVDAAALVEVDQHPAQRRMAVHRTHGADGPQLHRSGG